MAVNRGWHMAVNRGWMGSWLFVTQIHFGNMFVIVGFETAFFRIRNNTFTKE